jgi:hypothetical protein
MLQTSHLISEHLAPLQHTFLFLISTTNSRHEVHKIHKNVVIHTSEQHSNFQFYSYSGEWGVMFQEVYDSL